MRPGSSDTQLSLSPDMHSKSDKGARLKAHTPENIVSWDPKAPSPRTLPVCISNAMVHLFSLRIFTFLVVLGEALIMSLVFLCISAGGQGTRLSMKGGEQGVYLFVGGPCLPPMMARAANGCYGATGTEERSGTGKVSAET